MPAAGKSLLFGLVGDPVAHSLSPFILNRAFDNFNMDAIYVAFGVRPERLAASIAGLAALGVSGLNVTFPYKEEILYHIDAVSPEVEIIGAANTVVLFEDELQGYNTDAVGTAVALETFGDVSLDGANAFIYGLGGSARAAAYGLLERGAARVSFGTRSAGNAPLLVERLAFAFPEQTVGFLKLGVLDELAARRDAFRDADIVINATPVGMIGQPAGTLIEDPAWVRPEQLFFDLVYHPKHTPFLDTARRGGAKTLGGTAMLVSQAAESFRIWTDHDFDLREMAEAVDKFSRAEPPAGGRVT
jgi:shikimate dehydrogenase